MPNTTAYSFGDVVLVPFPFTNQTASKKRPAVVVSADVTAVYSAAGNLGRIEEMDKKYLMICLRNGAFRKPDLFRDRKPETSSSLTQPTLDDVRTSGVCRSPRCADVA
jgi:hypothetical protein